MILQWIYVSWLNAQWHMTHRTYSCHGTIWQPALDYFRIHGGIKKLNHVPVRKVTSETLKGNMNNYRLLHAESTPETQLLKRRN